MSRIGNKIIFVPDSVSCVSGEDGVLVSAKGIEHRIKFPSFFTFAKTSHGFLLSLDPSFSSDRKKKALHGLYRSLIQNAIDGLDKGFCHELELDGIGYRVQMQGKDLQFSLGYSHPVLFKCPETVTFEVEGVSKLRIKGHDKELVGRISSQIRELRKLDPYKAKGIHLSGSIRKKRPGKSVKK